jgi:hypothetical protein
LRRPNDAEGDAGICLVTFARTSEIAAELVDALRWEGVSAMRIYEPDTIDLHVYPYWKPVLDLIDSSGRDMPDRPRTLDLLERSIHVDVSPLCNETDIDEIAFAFEKAAAAVIS